MKFKNTFEIVTKDIQDLEKLIGNFKNYSRIPGIELDLALSKLRNIYDLLLMFRGTAVSSVEGTETPDSFIEDKKKEVTESIPEKELKSEGNIEPVGLTQSEPHHERDVTFAGVYQDTKKIPDQEKKTEQIKKTEREAEKTLADKFISDHSFINEKLGEKISKSNIASAFQASPIKSISGSVGINDKFFYIRELFNGDSELFNNTLNELDNSESFNTAYSYLTGKFDWNMDSDPVQKLLSLVKRKFIGTGNE